MSRMVTCVRRCVHAAASTRAAVASPVRQQGASALGAEAASETTAMTTGVAHRPVIDAHTLRVAVGLAGAALAFMAEFGSLRSNVSSLDKRMSDMSARMTENNSSLDKRMSDMSARMTESNASLLVCMNALSARMTENNERITSLKTENNERITSLKATVNELKDAIKDFQRALQQGGGNAPAVPQPPAVSTRAPRGEGAS